MTETMVLNLAYALYVGSGFIKTVARLRIGLLVVTAVFVVWGIVSQTWSAIGWNLAFGAVHGYQLIKLWRAQRNIDLDQRARSIHHKLFDDLSLLDFFTLWSLGHSRDVEPGTVLIAQGTDHHTILLVVDGTVVVERDGRELATLGSNATVGERSYITGEPANASVTVGDDGATLHEWNQQKVQALTQLCPPAHHSLMRHIGRDLATKL